MTTWINIAIAVILAYLLGALPFGLVIAKSRGIDIRKTGSGNIGATNVMRSVGKPWGILTLVLDAIKGLIPTAFFDDILIQIGYIQTPPIWLPIVCGVAAILGHSFPIYLGFRGGKGVATSAGFLLGIAPWSLLIGLITFALVFGASRYVSLGSLCAAIVVPVVSIWLASNQPLTSSVLFVLAALVIWRHKGNIVRLLNGTENQISFRRSPRL